MRAGWSDRFTFLRVVSLCLLAAGILLAATIVPNEVQQPGTQPSQVANLESPNKCDNCHGGYDQAVEPAFNWRGSMMANAGRDPLFWATLAVAEQDFDGAGDLCIRCHSTGGWHAGRSTPTDGSGLAAGDADGVDCDTCHKMTNPNNSEHLGVMTAPFVANDEKNPATGYYGSGMLSLWGGSEKLGPYSDPVARHAFLQSKFHRSGDFCGSCHDVSNPAVGDLAHNNGAPVPLAPGTYSGALGSPLEQKAAFNNLPYQYGVVERTHSDFKAGLLSQTLVSSYASLPSDLKAGAIQAAYNSAKGNYADGTPRYFTCQTCHMNAVTGKGCNKPDAPLRTDLPLHDMTGGNYWAPDAILYQNSQGTLRLGGALTTTQVSALQAGKTRAQKQLQLAASLSVSGNSLKITNLTGHKLITGYPEGRRMWLNIQWYDGGGNLLREDGKYGSLSVVIDGAPATVKTLLDPNDPNTRTYEAHYGMTQEWANQLLALGKPASLPLGFDRVTGAVDSTLGDLAAQPPGTSRETFHFVLNNLVVKDNRIPPYGMSYDEARKRNALPVPASQYSNPGPGGTFNYWDTVSLSPPASATHATIRLLYQPTSWEYIQFLYLANQRQNTFLADEGANLLQAWLNTGMAEPYVMASTTWETSESPPVAPQAVSVTPSSGSGASQTFSLLYSDDNGVADIRLAYVLFNTQVSAASSCQAYYDNASNRVYLRNDAGAGFLGPLTIGQAGTLQNSQCTIDAGASSVSKSGNNLTVNLALSFKPAFVGTKNIYMYVTDREDQVSGWQTRGSWNASAAVAPQAVSVTPSSGSGASQTFSLLYADGNGVADLRLAYVLFNTQVSAASSCQAYYDNASNRVYLRNDAGTGFLGPLTIGQPGTLENSQCTIDAGASSVAKSGNNLTVNLALSFKPAFAGNKSIYMYVTDREGLVSGWQMRGSWNTSAPVAPQAVSVTPNAGSGTSQTFALLYSDGNGVADLRLAYLMINSTLTWAGSCGVYYDNVTNSLYLIQDGGGGWFGPLTPGQAGTLENSQCTLDVGASSVAKSGNNLTVNLALSFKPAFAGTKSIFMNARDRGGLLSGWQTRGSWIGQ